MNSKVSENKKQQLNSKKSHLNSFQRIVHDLKDEDCMIMSFLYLDFLFIVRTQLLLNVL